MKTSDLFSKRNCIIGIILLVTLLSYVPSLQNDFLRNWDDQNYIANNEFVKDLSLSGIKRIFMDDNCDLYANYHPLTILSLALNYHEGVGPFPFHLTNLMLHLINTLLVFIFIYQISETLFVAGLVSLWFGIHPVHVESVAWISERKDVLYALFYLLALIAYRRYQKDLGITWYILTFVLFVCSVLSKTMAVSLPIVLFCIDYLDNRKFRPRLILEKIPFVAVAIIFGLAAFKLQTAGGAIESITFPFANRVLHALYGFSMYIAKMFIPESFSAFYPYPYPLVNNNWDGSAIPAVLYVTLFSSVVIIVSVLYMYFKQTPFAKHLVFGIAFYFASVALVLQYFPVGRAIISDRYMYIPSIGLFYIAGMFIHQTLSTANKQQFGKLLVVLAGVYSVVFCLLTIKQTRVWKNDATLWSNVIRNYPNDNRIILAYQNRALYYFNDRKYDDALHDFITVSKFNPQDDNALALAGTIYGNKNDLANAILYLRRAVDINPRNVNALHDLSTAYSLKGEYANALGYAEKALALAPNTPDLYLNVAVIMHEMGNLEQEELYRKKAAELGSLK